MFIINKSDSYFWPVRVQVPVDGGRFKEETFEAEFHRLTQSQVEALLEKLNSGELKEFDFMLALMKGWKGVKADGAEDLVFNDTNLALLLDLPNVSASLFEAWKDSRIGAKRKN
jgi:hypothetical protein